jgi:tetratricopeptide (TPR) repeat protein
LTEKEMARVALEFSRSKNYQQYCLEAYKLNIEFFSNSWKAYDDYANALLKNNQKENAIKMYKKSIEINPNNQNSKKVLEQISK